MRMPASSRIERTRKAVVVFPFVPVTPIMRSSALGSPKNRAAIGAIAARESGTTSCGTATSSSRSTTSATAPASTTAGAKSWPSAVLPRTQKNSVPGPTSRLSNATSVISRSVPSPATRASPSGSASLSSASLIARDSRNAAGGEGRRRADHSVGAIPRYGRANEAICPNAGAATEPP